MCFRGSSSAGLTEPHFVTQFCCSLLWSELPTLLGRTYFLETRSSCVVDPICESSPRKRHVQRAPMALPSALRLPSTNFCFSDYSLLRLVPSHVSAQPHLGDDAATLVPIKMVPTFSSSSCASTLIMMLSLTDKPPREPHKTGLNSF